MRPLFLLMLVFCLAVPASAQRPAGYPRSYDALIAEARAERGVRVYGNADAAAMTAMIATPNTMPFPSLQASTAREK